MGAGFLASGAAATDEVVEDAAIPFDRRRHGLIVGMGAAGLVVESAEAARERGLQPICEVLSAVTANSAFHGTRLDVQHISQAMESLVAKAEASSGIQRQQIAPRTVFVSHETYTPARGGSAAAEIHALREVFGNAADQIVIANTKGFTGHAMGAGVEDVLAVKALETGSVPPVANFKEIDPELGTLNLSKGGVYPIDYALRLGAGFGSQISMTLLRWVATKNGVHKSPNALGYDYRIVDADAWNNWLTRVAGWPSAELEMVQRTLRVRDQGLAGRLAETTAESQASPSSSGAPQPTPPVPVVVAKPTVPVPAVATRAARLPIPEFTEAKREAQATAATPLVPQEPFVESDSVKERILALVVEKTGYPKDMLDLDLDLEADLGVDTVKQAEMFAAIREIYNIPRDESRRLRDYPTLAHVIRFVYEKRPDLAAVTQHSATPPEKTDVLPKESPLAESAAEAGRSTDSAGDPVKERILALVVEKTGYPKDMLDLDLDLEADLGIDTVKQAEMFAAIRATYNIPRDENLKLRDFPTLAHIIQFARDRSGLQRSAVVSPAAPQEVKSAAEPPVSSLSTALPTPLPTPLRGPRPVLANLDAANAIPRRVPLPILRPPLSMCKRTGVTLDRGRRVVVVADKNGVGDMLAQLLRTKGVEVLRVDGTPDSETLANRLKGWIARGPVHGVYWLPALDIEARLADMNLAAWREAAAIRVKSLYTTMCILYEQIAPPGTFLIAATRLGGQHGYDEDGAVAPLGGAVAGFTKTYKRERTDALVKVVDFEAACNASKVAELLIEETLRDTGAVEIGYKSGLRWTIGLQEQPAADGRPGLTLNKDTVFVVTGAAGSIVSAIVADLAAASGGVFYLLDLVPEPDPDNADLKRLLGDKEGLKRELFARLQARGERATPAQVEKELAGLERAQAARTAIDSVRAAGGTAHYFSVDLTKADAVAKVVDQVRERSGRIDVLLHAAGIERSHFLPDKDPREFDLVFGVKSDGFFNLLHAIADMPLGTTVAFSSIAARFGNPGQTDYSAANDLLCKITSSFRNTRPKARGIAIDWTAWGQIGMASRGSIPKVMEKAGIDMLPPEAGVPLIRRELTAGGTSGEVVIGQRLGVLLKEWDDTGGIDTSIAAFPSQEHVAAQGPMLGKIASVGLFKPLTVETVLDPTVQPFLHDHKIDGTPVLPGVMGLEAFAEAAVSLLPTWHVAAIEDVEFRAPCKFYRSEPRLLTVEAEIHPDGDGIVADSRLIGRRPLANQGDPQITTHFTARVRLTKDLMQAPKMSAVGSPAGAIVEAADIYRLYFHGPAYQVIERAWWNGSQIVALMAQNLPGNHYPAELRTLISPRLIELCFQAAGVWEMGIQGRMGLPQHIDCVRLLGPRDPAEGRLFAVITPDAQRGSFDAEVLDEAGNRYVQINGYRTAAISSAVNAEPLRALQALMAAHTVAAA